MCLAECNWLKTKGNNTCKNELKGIFTWLRKDFDREVQCTKRQYWVQLQNEMVSSFDTNPRDFWKIICCTGVAENRNQKTPFEDYNEEGSLNTDPKSVLQKWKHDFEKMYNIQASCGNDQESNLQGLWVIYIKIKATRVPAIFVVQSLSGKSVEQSYT